MVSRAAVALLCATDWGTFIRLYPGRKNKTLRAVADAFSSVP